MVRRSVKLNNNNNNNNLFAFPFESNPFPKPTTDTTRPFYPSHKPTVCKQPLEIFKTERRNHFTLFSDPATYPNKSFYLFTKLHMYNQPQETFMVFQNLQPLKLFYKFYLISLSVIYLIIFYYFLIYFNYFILFIIIIFFYFLN